jgi:hypothetical protein
MSYSMLMEYEFSIYLISIIFVIVSYAMSNLFDSMILKIFSLSMYCFVLVTLLVNIINKGF